VLQSLNKPLFSTIHNWQHSWFPICLVYFFRVFQCCSVVWKKIYHHLAVNNSLFLQFIYIPSQILKVCASLLPKFLVNSLAANHCDKFLWQNLWYYFVVHGHDSILILFLVFSFSYENDMFVFNIFLNFIIFFRSLLSCTYGITIKLHHCANSISNFLKYFKKYFDQNTNFMYLKYCWVFSCWLHFW
jgi:hypothetical protein